MLVLTINFMIITGFAVIDTLFFVTVRKNCGKVMFSQVCVKNSVLNGMYPSMYWGRQPPGQTPPGRQPPGQTPPGRDPHADTPGVCSFC